MDVRKPHRPIRSAGRVLRNVHGAVGPVLLLPIDLNRTGTSGRHPGGILQLQQRHVRIQRGQIETIVHDDACDRERSVAAALRANGDVLRLRVCDALGGREDHVAAHDGTVTDARIDIVQAYDGDLFVSKLLLLSSNLERCLVQYNFRTSANIVYIPKYRKPVI